MKMKKRMEKELIENIQIYEAAGSGKFYMLMTNEDVVWRINISKEVYDLLQKMYK